VARRKAQPANAAQLDRRLRLLKQKSRQMDSRFDPHMILLVVALHLDRPAMRSVRVDCGSDRIDEADNGLWLSPFKCRV